MKYNKIKPNDVSNGDGVSVSLFTQGCPHHCVGCFNKETWTMEDGKEFTHHTIKYILHSLNRNNVDRHLSILGGEPLIPRNEIELSQLCRQVKDLYPNKKIWLWTGYLYEDVKDNEVLKYVDVLIDGKFDMSKKNLSLKYKGSENQRVIDLKETIKQNKIVLYC